MKDDDQRSYHLFGFPILETKRRRYGDWYFDEWYTFFDLFTIRRRPSLKSYLRTLNIQLYQQTLSLRNKISLQNDQNVVELPCGTKFYVPLYPDDYIQRILVEERCFYTQKILDELQCHIPEESTILDIGANIGNHSLYWARHSGAKRIHSFEPLPMTYRILQENIRLNGLEEIIIAHNLGLSDKNEHTLLDEFDLTNIGATRFKSVERGKERKAKMPFKFVTLDSLALAEEKIDFIKIDVEGFERQVLTGAYNTLLSHKPILFIESLPENIAFVKDFCKEIGYQTPISYPVKDYLFLPRA